MWRTAATKAWREAAEGWKARTEERDEELRHRLMIERELREAISAQAQTIAKLESLPSLEHLLKVMTDTSAAHEKRAQERHDVQIRTAQAILDRVNATHPA